jgi:hypothetical protein
VNSAHQVVGRAGGDRKAFEQRAVGLFPGIPKPREAKELAVFDMISIGCLVLPSLRHS